MSLKKFLERKNIQVVDSVEIPAVLIQEPKVVEEVIIDYTENFFEDDTVEDDTVEDDTVEDDTVEDDTVEDIIATEPVDYKKMSKLELDNYALYEHNIALDRRKTKADMIRDLEKEINKKNTQ